MPPDHCSRLVERTGSCWPHARILGTCRVYMCGTLVPGPAALTGKSTCVARWFQGEATGLVSLHVWHVGSRASRPDW